MTSAAARRRSLIRALPLLAAAAMAPPARAAEGEGARTPSPPGAYLYIGWPTDGATVRSPFKVWFGLRNMGVAPAGVERPNTGHHHLIIDADLPPGRHTLQLLLGDARHVPFDPPVASARITITVVAR